MAVPTATLPEIHAKAFLRILEDTLRRGQPETREKYKSITEAVPVVFVRIRNEAPENHPLRQYSLRDLSAAALTFGKEDQAKLNGLCNIPALAWATRDTKQALAHRLFKKSEDFVDFVDYVIENPSRPEISLAYGIPLEKVAAVFTIAVQEIAVTAAGTDVRKWYGDCSSSSPNFQKFISAPSLLQLQLEQARIRAPNWKILDQIEYDPETATVRPTHANWSFPPSREEIDILTQLQNDRRKPDAAETPVQTSLSGASPEEFVSTRTGKRLHHKRAAAKILGD